MVKIAYIDMDGVLADLNSKMEELNISFDELAPNFIRAKDFFLKFIEEEHFRNLKTLPFQKVLDYLVEKDIELQVLSSIGAKQNAVLGEHKSDWINKHYPNTFTKLNFAPGKKCKKQWATSETLLIDDHPKNVSDFIENGGIAILHKNEEKTLEMLKNILP